MCGSASETRVLSRTAARLAWLVAGPADAALVGETSRWTSGDASAGRWRSGMFVVKTQRASESVSLTCPIDNACRRHTASVHVRSIPADHIPGHNRVISPAYCSSRPSRSPVATLGCCVRRVSHKSCQRSIPRRKTDSDSSRSRWSCCRSSCCRPMTAWGPFRSARCKDSMELRSGRCCQRRTSVESDWFVCRRRWAAIWLTRPPDSRAAFHRWWFAVTNDLPPSPPRSERSWTASRRNLIWRRHAAARTAKCSSFPTAMLTRFASCLGGKIAALIYTERAPNSEPRWQFQHIRSPVNCMKGFSKVQTNFNDINLRPCESGACSRPSLRSTGPRLSRGTCRCAAPAPCSTSRPG